MFDIADGKLSGNVSFGSGQQPVPACRATRSRTGNLTFGAGADTMTPPARRIFNGAVDFGGGADTLTIGGTSSFTGAAGQCRPASRCRSRRAPSASSRSASIASLTVTDGGTLGVTARQDPGRLEQPQCQPARRASPTGSKLQLSVANVAQAEGHFIVLNAGTLTGGGNLAATTDLLPFLYKGALTVTGNQVAVDISRKTAAELGLNKSESAAYAAIYEALGTDDEIGDQLPRYPQPGRIRRHAPPDASRSRRRHVRGGNDGRSHHGAHA